MSPDEIEAFIDSGIRDMKDGKFTEGGPDPFGDLFFTPGPGQDMIQKSMNAVLEKARRDGSIERKEEINESNN